MGLEPTTFCMATGSRARSVIGSNSHGYAELKLLGTHAPSPKNRLISRRFIHDLGTSAQTGCCELLIAERDARPGVRQYFRAPKLRGPARATFMLAIRGARRG
jgi:hypothetical protein